MYESEREDRLDNYISNVDSRDAPTAPLFRRDLGHKSIDRIAVKHAGEFLELLFELSLSLVTENFMDGQSGSILLIYFSVTLGFSPDCRQFQPAREYCFTHSPIIFGFNSDEIAEPVFSLSMLNSGSYLRIAQVILKQAACYKKLVISLIVTSLGLARRALCSSLSMSSLSRHISNSYLDKEGIVGEDKP